VKAAKNVSKWKFSIMKLISVVIGALVLASFYTLFGNTVLPELQRRISEMFSYNG